MELTEWHMVGPMLVSLIVCLSKRMRGSRPKVQEFVHDWLGREHAQLPILGATGVHVHVVPHVRRHEDRAFGPGSDDGSFLTHAFTLREHDHEAVRFLNANDGDAGPVAVGVAVAF